MKSILIDRTHALGAAALVGMFLLLASPAFAAGESFFTQLDPAQEVPPVENATTTGEATLEVLSSGGIAYTLHASSSEPLTAAHLHCAPRGENGPIIVPLSLGTTTASSTTASSTGEIMESSLTDNCDFIDSLDDLLAELRAGDIYVNVHSAAHPDGVGRGQLEMIATTTPDETNGTSTATTTPDTDTNGTSTATSSDDSDFDLDASLSARIEAIIRLLTQIQMRINDLFSYAGGSGYMLLQY